MKNLWIPLVAAVVLAAADHSYGAVPAASAGWTYTSTGLTFVAPVHPAPTVYYHRYDRPPVYVYRPPLVKAPTVVKPGPVIRPAPIVVRPKIVVPPWPVWKAYRSWWY